MSNKMAELMKNYRERKHLEKKEASKQLGITSFSPLWHMIEEFTRQTEDKNTDQLERENSLDDSHTNLGILLIIIDDLPNEALWRLWSEEVGDRVKIWIHAKEPNRISSNWVRKRLAKSFHLKPKWASLELTKVMVALLAEAISDAPEIKKFVFASESCLPIAPVETVFRELYKHDTEHYSHSWISAKNIPNNGFANFKQFKILQEKIPSQFVWKADQWVMISRQHALKILDLCNYLQVHSSQSKPPVEVRDRGAIIHNPIFQIFAGTNASDELFFATVLSMLGHTFAGEEACGSVPNIILKRRVTFADWTDCVDSPKTFHTLSPEVLLPAQEEGNLFFRKMKCQLFLDKSGLISLEDKIQLFLQWFLLVYGDDLREVGITFATDLFSAAKERDASKDEPIYKKQKI